MYHFWNTKAFSSNVYGELQPQLVNDMIKKSCIKKDSLFIDLGCGVGNVVLQVAAQTGCTSVGIEIADNPSALSTKHLAEFKARAKLVSVFI